MKAYKIKQLTVYTRMYIQIPINDSGIVQNGVQVITLNTHDSNEKNSWNLKLGTGISKKDTKLELGTMILTEILYI